MASVVAESLSSELFSPELCLVCPELRALALARPPADVPPAVPELLAPMPVRVGAYVALRTTQTATECLLFFAVVSALVLAASLT